MSCDQQLEELLSLLESSYSCEDSTKLQEISQSIKEYEKNFDNFLSLLFKGLSLTSFNNKQISLNLHKSMAVNLKNVIKEKSLDMDDDKIYIYLQKIFVLFFSTIFNPNLSNESIISIFENIITFLLSRESMKFHCEDLFKILVQAVNSKPSISEDFIIKSKIVVRFCKGLFASKNFTQENFVKIVNDYYIAIIDSVLQNINIYFDPNKNLYNDDYISLLNNLIEDMYTNLKNLLKINFGENSKFNEIIKNIFKKYGPIIYELIKIQIPFDKESEKIFINQNSIIVFNISEKKCANINNMKSKCFQFFSFTTEQLSYKDSGKVQNSILKDEKLIEINAELIKLIVSSFQDILSNKAKYDLIKNPKEGIFNYEKSYNILIFNMILLLLRCLTREPIKSEFVSHIKYFTLNILFPLTVSTEEEKIFLEQEPDMYSIYLNDIINDFKSHNFRTAFCYLLKKICINYVDMNNFILSYIIEMINYIFHHENNKYNNVNDNYNIYNIYLDGENKSLINNFNDEIKIDFCFLVLLLLKDNFIKHNLLKNKFFSFFVQNQDKIHHINSTLILTKVCKIYNEYCSQLFKYLQSETETQLKNSFIEKTINILLDYIINNNPNDIHEILISEASDTIISLFRFAKNTDMKTLYLKEIFIEKFQFYFKNMIKLIDMIDNPSLNIVISCIIEQIFIKERQDILNCLQSFTKKFEIIVNTNYNYVDKEEEIKNKALFINQYFILLGNYLKGVNKFDILNKSEIIQFNNIISPVISYISEPEKYAFCQEIVNIGEYYILALNSINEISIKILDNLLPIIKREKVLNGDYYSFISIFLCHINKNTNYAHFIETIINIIKLNFSFPKETFYENNLSALLLCMQIFNLESQINYDTLKWLIIEIFKCYFSYFIYPDEKEYQDILILNERSLLEKIQQVIIANISLCFIYYPENMLKIIKENLGEIYNKGNNKNDMNNLRELLINLYSSIFDLVYPYYSILGKCDIFCLCSIIRNKSIFNILCDDVDKKILLLKLLINFVVKHKEESVKIQAKLTNSEIKCGFVNSDNEESENDEENDYEDSENSLDNSFYENIKNILKENTIFMNNDEFKIFSETLYQIKINDEVLSNELSKNFNKKETKMLNDLLFVRNVKVEYNGKKFEVPRRTLKIKRNIH